MDRHSDYTRSVGVESGRPNSFEGQEHRRRRREEKPPPKYHSRTYEPLPRKRGFIRVLTLRGSSLENPVIDCELIVREFSKDHEIKPPYEALSWCWGTAKPTAYIQMRKKGKVYAKYVQPELVAALRALRYRKGDRYLWIDAICINQKNPQEKNHQVEMMSEIYGRAERVCVWLGEGDKSSRVALKFVQEEVLQLQNFDELCESELASDKWKALLDLMQRPWFSRRWVVQEISLARKAMVYCGLDEITWQKFAVAVELFVEVETATHRLSEVMKKDPRFYHVPGWFEYVSALGASLLVEATGKLFRDSKPSEYQEKDSEFDRQTDSGSESGPESNAVSSIESDSGSDTDFEEYSDAGGDFPIENGLVSLDKEPRQPLLSLEYLVSSLSIFDVTEPHDAVYALLAIAKDTIPSADDEKTRLVREHTQKTLEGFTMSKKYRVDYEQPYSDVCKEFVEFCTNDIDQTRALDIICRPWAPEARQRTSTKRKAAKDQGPAAERGETAKKSNSSAKATAAQNPRKKSRKSRNRAKSQTLRDHEQDSEDEIPLPSWIPQLSGAAYAMLPQAGVHTLKMNRKNADTLVGLPSSSQSLQRNYNAAETKGIDRKSFRFRKSPAMKYHSMCVKGFILDTIVNVQPSSQSGAIPRSWAKVGGWRNAPFDDPPDHFWRTLVADRGRDGKNPPVYYARACKESFIKGGLLSGSVNTTDLINNERCSVIAQFCRRVQAVIWNRCLIKTQSGRLGLASQHARVGDIVCILYGCSVPVVLRREWKSQSQIEQEVAEDVKSWILDRVLWWRDLSNTNKASRWRRELFRTKWMLWNHKMRTTWHKDKEWQKTWNMKVSERQASQELLKKDDLTRRIADRGRKMPETPSLKKGLPKKEGKCKIEYEEEEMGSFLKNDDETEEEYKDRLRMKGYQFWKRERREVEKNKAPEDSAWDEPRPNWREFELRLRYGRVWKAFWLRRKHIKDAKQRLLNLEKELLALRSAAGDHAQNVRGDDQRPRTLNGIIPRPLHGRHEAITGDNENGWDQGAKGEIDRDQKPENPKTKNSKPEKPEKPKDLKMKARDPEESRDAEFDDELTGKGNGIAKNMEDEKADEAETEEANMQDEKTEESKSEHVEPEDEEREKSGAAILTEKFMKEFTFNRDGILKEPIRTFITKRSENAEARRQEDETERVQQKWCYYELLGECYIHGMMDGEAMAYQNAEEINAQVFEIR